MVVVFVVLQMLANNPTFVREVGVLYFHIKISSRNCVTGDVCSSSETISVEIFSHCVSSCFRLATNFLLRREPQLWQSLAKTQNTNMLATGLAQTQHVNETLELQTVNTSKIKAIEKNTHKNCIIGKNFNNSRFELVPPSQKPLGISCLQQSKPLDL